MPDLPTVCVLLIDGSKNQRTYWADQLKQCSADYEIVEARDGQSGMKRYRSRRIHCVVLELDPSGFKTLVELVPIASRPRIPVVVLTQMTQRGISELAKENGAYACLVKQHTSGDDLDRAIQRAMTFVGNMPKEDRYSTL